MSDSIFPCRRADESFSVAIKYTVSRSDAVRAARHLVNGWIEMKRNRDHLEMATEFTHPPRVDSIDSRTMQIVLDCRPGSVLWKGLMIELARMLDGVEGIERSGFWDLVTGLAHPASIER